MRKRTLARIAVFISLCSLLGCAEKPPEPIAEVEGAVTYDGELVVSGIISFLPIDAPDRTPGGGAIRKGKYRVYPEVGLKPGLYRVEIRWAKPTGEKKEAGYGKSSNVVAEALPEKYNLQSILKADLKPGSNTVDFKLEK